MIGIRKFLGGIIVFIGFLLIIPSIFGFLLASEVYGDPKLSQTYDMTPITVGTTQQVNIDGQMLQGRNYDIRISISVEVQDPNVNLGMIKIYMDLTSSGADIAEISNSEFYRSSINKSSSISKTYEYETNFVANNDVDLTFEIIQVAYIQDIDINIRIYENPDRYWSGVITNISAILLIPGIIVIIIGACVTGPKRK